MLERLAACDALTGLPNRRALEDAIRRASARQKRGAESMLLFLDADNFKTINDTVGHIAGDQALATFAYAIENCLRADDFLARVGGDEFAVLLDQTGIEEATEIAERIRKAVESHNFVLDGQEFRLGVSVGMVSVSGENPWSLMSRADKAMYKAKSKGRNQIVLAK